MICAAESGHADAISLLLQKDAEINHQNLIGETALFEAVVNGQVNVVQLLLKEGADTSIVNKKGVTVNHIAKRKRLKEIKQLLKQAHKK